MDIRGMGNPTRRRLGGLGAVLLLAMGASGGYVALASAGTASSSPGASSGRRSVGVASSPATADAPAQAIGGDATGDGGAAAVACPMIPASDPTGDSSGVGSASHVFTRTTADGVTIRTYLLPSTGVCGCGPIPAASAGSPSTQSVASGAEVSEGVVSIELSDDTAVGEGTLFTTSGPSATTANAGTDANMTVSDAFGVAEGTPVWWTALPVGPDVANATMTFADASTDQMAPVDGLVVLAHPIDPTVASSGQGPFVVRGTLRLFNAAGAVLQTVALPESASSPVLPPIAVPGSPPVGVAGSGTPTAVPTPLSSSGNSTTVACPDAAISAPSPKVVVRKRP